MNNKVSIVVPTKNSGATLKRCLESIRAQSYTQLELIVVDNYSTDNTPAIAMELADKVLTIGPERSTQRNVGVGNSTGKFVAIIDSDMELSPTVIQECVDTMTDKVSGVIIPEESFGVGFWAQCKKLERSFYLGVPYMEAARFFRKADFKELGGYNEQLVSGEDWDLSQRMETLGVQARTEGYIYHNEGHISLLKSVKKKYYYAQKFAMYQKHNRSNSKVMDQISLFGRYRLFFSQPKKLFNKPVLGLGMLFMKTCEFGFGGLGLLAAKLHS